MTLAELMIVIAIIGLLAVTVLPAIDASRGRKAGRDAAEMLVSHISQAASKGIGSSQGTAVWLQTDSTGAGTGYAVTQLGFARPRADVSGSTTMNRISSGTATVPAATFPTAVRALLPAPIRFAGIPAVFTALASGTEIACADNDMNRTIDNSLVPNSPTTALPFTLNLRPNRMPSVRARSMPKGMCVDFAWSSIGLAGVSISTVSLAGPDTRLAITFDAMGRAEYAWCSVGTAGSWQAIRLDSSKPVVLLVGYATQAGSAPVQVPSEDNPGATWQSPDARWVVVDSRSSIVRVVECDAAAATVAYVNKLADGETVARQAGLSNALQFVYATLQPGS